MRSRRSLEGVMVIDHQESPGLAPAEAVAAGLRRVADKLGPGTLAEIPVATCSHCQAQVILRPGRTRARAVCSRCDKYLCDRCATNYRLTSVCYPWTHRMEDALRRAVLNQINRSM